MSSIVLYFLTVTPNSLSALEGYSIKAIILSSNIFLQRSPPVVCFAFGLAFKEMVPFLE